jgi:hypothetical protein
LFKHHLLWAPKYRGRKLTTGDTFLLTSLMSNAGLQDTGRWRFLLFGCFSLSSVKPGNLTLLVIINGVSGPDLGVLQKCAV